MKRRLNRPLSSTVKRVSIPNGDLNQNNNFMDDQIFEDLNDDEDQVISEGIEPV